MLMMTFEEDGEVWTVRKDVNLAGGVVQDDSTAEHMRAVNGRVRFSTGNEIEDGGETWRRSTLASGEQHASERETECAIFPLSAAIVVNFVADRAVIFGFLYVILI